MSGFNKSKVVKTRKVHICHGCLNLMPVGSTAINNKGYYEDWYNYYLHPECEKIAQKFGDFFQDGVFEGFVHELANHYGEDKVYEKSKSS
ncbi:hypothetical protein [Virgibacillus kimchii]